MDFEGKETCFQGVKDYFMTTLYSWSQVLVGGYPENHPLFIVLSNLNGTIASLFAFAHLLVLQ